MINLNLNIYILLVITSLNLFLKNNMETSTKYHVESLKVDSNKKQIYDDWSDTYDTYVNSIKYTAPGTLVELFLSCIKKEQSQNGIKKKLKILDFGCGTGLLGMEIKKQMLECHLEGIDISKGMIQKCVEKGVYDRLYCKNIIEEDNSIKDTDEAYDVIMCCGAFLEGHLSLSIILNNFVNLLANNSIICFTIRDSYYNDNLDEFNNIIQDKHIRLISMSQIKYLDGVNAWGILLGYEI